MRRSAAPRYAAAGGGGNFLRKQQIAASKLNYEEEQERTPPSSLIYQVNIQFRHDEDDDYDDEAFPFHMITSEIRSRSTGQRNTHKSVARTEFLALSLRTQILLRGVLNCL